MGDHVTLMYRPTELELRGFEVGKQLEIMATHIHQSSTLQGVKVEYRTKSYHITVATIPGIAPRLMGEVDESSWVPLATPLRLVGTLGLQVQPQNDPLQSLPQRIQKRIQDFVATSEPGQRCRFNPNELSAAERAILHEYAERWGLAHMSSGKLPNRKFTLVMGRHTREKIEESADLTEDAVYEHAYDLEEGGSKRKGGKRKKPLSQLKQRRIFDPHQFATLKYAVPNTPLPLAGVVIGDEDSDGSVGGKIEWFQEPKWGEQDLIILRGLPGTGKSQIAKLLGGSRCSADIFFTHHDGTYHYEESRLEEAHGWCQAQVEEAMKITHPRIVVDNTNSRVREYASYVKLAEEYEYQLIIIELHTHAQEQLDEWAERGTHSVPQSALRRMLSRWETDDRALLLQPYSMNQSISSGSEMALSHWLSYHHLFHFHKKRRATHLQMAVGKQSATFIDLPPQLEEEFMQRYIDSGLDEKGEPKYLSELFQDRFRMVIDFDYIDETPFPSHFVPEMAKFLSIAMGGPVAVIGVTTTLPTGGYHTGYHLHGWNSLVTFDKVKKIINRWLELLQDWEPLSWEDWIDRSLYLSGNGIRMLGSRKATKGQDMGRIYRWIGEYVDDNWTVKPPTLIDQLKKTSIRP